MAARRAQYASEMPRKSPKDSTAARLAQLKSLAASLPQTTSAPFGARHLVFRVAKKTFAYYLNSHHDDGIIALCCKSTRARQRELLAADPGRYYAPKYLGPSGWIALRLDTRTIDWGVVLELLVHAYKLQAPRRLAAEMD